MYLLQQAGQSRISITQQSSSTPAPERFPTILSVALGSVAIVGQAVGRFNPPVSDRFKRSAERCYGCTVLLALAAGCCATLSRPASVAATCEDNVASPESPNGWRKPEPGRLKLNFDGSSKRESRSASIGGVYRDHEGRFVLGYAEPIGTATSSVAELASLRRGLELAVDNGWRSVWIEGDNKAAVDVLRSCARVRGQEQLRLWEEIEALLPFLDDMSVSHVRREGNWVAHGFAKLAHGVASPTVWRDVPPDEVLRFLQRDAEVLTWAGFELLLVTWAGFELLLVTRPGALVF